MTCGSHTVNNMIGLLLLTFSILIGLIQSHLTFPRDFKFGVATASYQVEGAWNMKGKGENIWDKLTHDHPDWVADRTNGDIACDSYHQTQTDTEMLKWLSVDFYRFSLSWSRLLPTGYANKINPDGLRYYNELINTLLAANITPMVTLYHWDLPQPLQEIGGWPNGELAKFYVDYARVAFESFGDRVKWWITFNEPIQTCQAGYGNGDDAPAYTSDGIGTYMCGRTLLLAHARAYHLYDREFRATQKGNIGITISASWFEPETNSTKDIAAAETALQMTLGWWAHPIFSKTGDYPAIMKKRIAKTSKAENFPRSRLHPFTAKEVQMIRSTFDFFGLNHYSSEMTNATPQKWRTPSLVMDIGVTIYQDPSWPASGAPWLKVVPWGFRKLLNWIKKEYDNPLIIITENGYADTGSLVDDERVNYHKEYLNALLEAIQDGCNVQGYAVWSLMDNFEWRQGYTQRFGLFHVDFDSLNRTRTAKKSASFYKAVIKNRLIATFPVVDIV